MSDLNPENLRLEDLDAVVRQSEETLRRLGGVFGELETVTGEGTGADGLARALVDGAGQIKEITLEPRIMRLDSQAVAEAVTQAVRAAQEAARRANEELLRAATGASRSRWTWTRPAAVSRTSARTGCSLDDLRRD